LEEYCDETARPLKLLGREISEGVGSVAVRDRVQGVYAAPSRRVEHHCRGVVLRKFRPQASDLTQRPGSDGVVGSDAQRRAACGVAGLQRAMQESLGIQASPRSPTSRRVLVANAW